LAAVSCVTCGARVGKKKREKERRGGKAVTNLADERGRCVAYARGAAERAHVGRRAARCRARRSRRAPWRRRAARAHASAAVLTAAWRADNISRIQDRTRAHDRAPPTPAPRRARRHGSSVARALRDSSIISAAAPLPAMARRAKKGAQDDDEPSSRRQAGGAKSVRARRRRRRRRGTHALTRKRCAGAPPCSSQRRTCAQERSARGGVWMRRKTRFLEASHDAWRPVPPNRVH
jgi:hypothetical protein